MILYHNPDGSLYSFEFAVDTPPVPLSYLVIDNIYNNQSIINRIVNAFTLPSERAQWQVVGGSLFYAGVQQQIATDAEWRVIKSQYQAAVNRLMEIENAGTIPFTQAGFTQVANAVRDMAKYQRYVIEYLRKTRQ